MIAVALVYVKIGGHFYNIPGARFPVIGQINKVLIVVERQRDLIAIKRPGAELHDARLLIERKIGDINCAGALINGRRHPEHLARGIDEHV